MSTLRDKLQELTRPKKIPTNVSRWLKDLPAEDLEAVWEYLTNPEVKSYTLLGIFRDSGMRASKDTFLPFRKSVLAGEIKRSDFDE